jgi:hypothetical protein
VNYLSCESQTDRGDEEAARADWVGELEGDVDYRELMRSKGVTVPDVDDSSSMKDVADGGIYASEAEGTMEGQDVLVGTPVQGSTIGDVDPKSQALFDTQEQSQALIHSHPSATVTGEVTAKSSTPLNTVINKEPSALKKELPLPILTVKPKALPLKIVEKRV